MTGPAALLWDVDGTLAETERDGHRVAFNGAFEALGVPWRWDAERYGALLAVAGGRERLLHDMAARDDAPATPDERLALARELHARKNAIYAELVGGGRVPLRAGVRELLEECRTQGLGLGIATTTSRANVAALLEGHLGAAWPAWFGVIVFGEDVARKKPDPAVYQAALHGLGLVAARALAIEDSPAGVAAARAAGVPVIVTRSVYFATGELPGALAVGDGLDQPATWHPSPAAAATGRVSLDDLRRWHATGEHAPD